MQLRGGGRGRVLQLRGRGRGRVQRGDDGGGGEEEGAHHPHTPGHQAAAGNYTHITSAKLSVMAKC